MLLNILQAVAVTDALILAVRVVNANVEVLVTLCVETVVITTAEADAETPAIQVGADNLLICRMMLGFNLINSPISSYIYYLSKSKFLV